MEESRLILISGESGVGKTTFCKQIIRRAQQERLDVAGILSPAVFHQGRKSAINALAIRDGEERCLAKHVKGNINGSFAGTCQWEFDAATIAWGNEVLADSLPCDILIVDELGPLEFHHQAGWQAGFQAISRRRYRLGVVVIRPLLLPLAYERWPWAVERLLK